VGDIGMYEELLERLEKHRLLGESPRAELEWLIANGTLRHLRVGDIVSSPQHGPVEELFILLSGRVGMYIERAGVPRRVIEWKGGDVTGLLPYSRLRVPPGTGRVEEPVDVLVVHGSRIESLTRECPVVTGKLVQQMLDRARHFQQDTLHDARMASLGRLAAGLAHELDNPASAVIRSAKLLDPLLRESDAASRALGQAAISPQEFASIEALRDGCMAAPVQQVRSPLEQGRHEEAIAEWLEERGLSVDSAEALAETPVTVAMLSRLEDAVPRGALDPAIRWVAAGCAVRDLANELTEAAGHISDLVRAVKGFSQMDNAATPQPVDVEQGLSQTLAVLRSKARARSVRVSIHADPDLPNVMAIAGELNQVWSNLIDNAIDAVGDGGSVEVNATREGEFVVVRVVDDGSGVPQEIQKKVFEPFFTTKPIGKGTGLGLDIVRRLVDRNNGMVELRSAPGRTEFRVTLPLGKRGAAVPAMPAAGGAAK
jgi:signal transduction histidine kinase